ncbi:MAG TPA: lipopolysaccharide biosynthesis protein [Rhodocyclaceae bacterium]|nr:lipopolysaccharide biosynthesis protein [Rhodocyclaceae bacterium]
MSLASTAIRGAYFTSLALAARQLISFLTIFYLARILAPADFGLAAMVMVVVAFAQVVGDVGFSAGLVRTQQTSAVAYSTCFWIGIGIGLVLAVLMALAAPLAAWFYEEAAVVPLLRVAAIGLLINFCMPVPLAILQQRLGYKEIAVAQASGSVLGALTAIACATAGLGIWSLVLQPIVGNIASLALMLFRAGWLPKRQFELATVRDILRDGMNLLGSGLSQYASNNFDTFVIGRALDSQDLGIYSMTRTVLYAPNYLITSVVSRVIFPLLAKIQDELPKVRDAVLTAAARTGLLAFPLYLGMLVVADDFVRLAFGPNWQGMVPLLRVMILPAMVQSIGHIASPILVALGASRLAFRLSLAGALFYFVVLISVIGLGLQAVAYGYALAHSLIGALSILLAVRQAGIRKRDFAMAVGKPLLMAAAMAALVFLLALELATLSPLARMATLIAAGALIYALLIVTFERAAWRQVRQAFSRKAG